MIVPRIGDNFDSSVKVQWHTTLTKQERYSEIMCKAECLMAFVVIRCYILCSHEIDISFLAVWVFFHAAGFFPLSNILSVLL